MSYSNATSHKYIFYVSGACAVTVAGLLWYFVTAVTNHDEPHDNYSRGWARDIFRSRSAIGLIVFNFLAFAAMTNAISNINVWIGFASWGFYIMPKVRYSVADYIIIKLHPVVCKSVNVVLLWWRWTRLVCSNDECDGHQEGMGDANDRA